MCYYERPKKIISAIKDWAQDKEITDEDLQLVQHELYLIHCHTSTEADPKKDTPAKEMTRIILCLITIRKLKEPSEGSIAYWEEELHKFCKENLKYTAEDLIFWQHFYKIKIRI